jgi:hypothetical protein
MSMWKWVGLGIGFILLVGLFESGIVAKMMVVLSVTVFLLLCVRVLWLDWFHADPDGRGADNLPASPSSFARLV